MSFTRRAANTTTPLPYIFTPSGTFDGNDGSWSSFIINIGDSTGDGSSGQNFKVLISTSGSVTWIPMQASWCDEPDQSTCAEARGVQTYNAKQSLGFQSNASSTWKEIGIYDLHLPLNLEYTPDLKPNASYGTDIVGLGPDSSITPQLPAQLVAEIETEDFFMGSFGLSTQPVTLGGGPIATFLTDFNYSNCTPSLSYGYTAGAQYRNDSKGVLASLILGGFDHSRFTTQGTSISMPGNGNSSLIVGVESIVVAPDPSVDSNQYSMTANNQGFSALIDSTLPYLWLPQAVCDNFAARFQLTYDSTTKLYTVNDTSHAYNLKQNATVSFKIGSTANPSNTFTSIVLPYAAFDLQASFPIYQNATNYFPIRQSPTGLYVLGRTFLQEAYIIVDYERNNFTVAPANFSDPMPNPNVVIIHSTSFVAPEPPKKSSGLPTGAIAGIAVAAVVIILALLLGLFFCWYRPRKRRNKGTQVAEIDTLVAGTEVKNRRISELGSEPGSPPPRFSSAAGFYGDQDNKDRPVPPTIHEIALQELESPPEVLELESPPLSEPAKRTDAQYIDSHVRRREARKDADQGLVGPRIHELPGDDGMFQVQGQHFEPVHSRGPSGESVPTDVSSSPSDPHEEELEAWALGQKTDNNGQNVDGEEH
ncbi:acid protease [Lepidopterella palustris CBS 459.81]|uniref:Acid protease n=1 Tax=Lepidopterella palustris CBS 459.81 TaxID=1314670 RepID=A0A8E2E6N7_9PEZI|nr:acid protease [Lepidopterella palustris CBS 459.81]